jgi:MoxR-like ATPase
MSNARDAAIRVKELATALSAGLIERETEIELALLALLAGEHLLLIGPPGTGKSMVAKCILEAVKDPGDQDRCFERLMTEFTVPEEIFGPVKISALKEDRFERNTKGYLPTARIAFLDEIFKSNSAILNSLLTIMNERLFDQGSRREPVPLELLIGASNELPEGQKLSALQDRFLLQKHVDYISKDEFEDFIKSPVDEAAPIPPLNADDVKAIREAAKDVRFEPGALELISVLRSKRPELSDRRWKKAANLLRIIATLKHRDWISILDCKVLAFVIGRPTSTDARAVESLLLKEAESVQKSIALSTKTAETSFDKLLDELKRRPGFVTTFKLCRFSRDGEHWCIIADRNRHLDSFPTLAAAIRRKTDTAHSLEESWKPSGTWVSVLRVDSEVKKETQRLRQMAPRPSLDSIPFGRHAESLFEDPHFSGSKSLSVKLDALEAIANLDLELRTLNVLACYSPTNAAYRKYPEFLVQGKNQFQCGYFKVTPKVEEYFQAMNHLNMP